MGRAGGGIRGGGGFSTACEPSALIRDVRREHGKVIAGGDALGGQEIRFHLPVRRPPGARGAPRRGGKKAKGAPFLKITLLSLSVCTRAHVYTHVRMIAYIDILLTARLS